MKAIAIAVFFVFASQVPADAARVVPPSHEPPGRAFAYPLHLFRVEVYRYTGASGTTTGQYRRWRQAAVAAEPTGYSNRRGAPEGLFRLAAYDHQGVYRKRCIFQVDQSGRQVAIGYKLYPWAFHAFQAGPCLVPWEAGGRAGLYIEEGKEGFSRGFVTAPANRRVVCVDRPLTKVVVIRFQGSLWRAAPEILKGGVHTCLNLDGGGQTKEHALQPAVLGIVHDPLPGGF